MASYTRLLQNGYPRDLETGENRLLESNVLALPVSTVYQFSVYPWTDRTGITVPDIVGPLQVNTLTPSATNGFGSLLVTADGAASGMVIGISIVLWDDRNNPTSVNSGNITLSTWAKNAGGNYIAANGFGANVPGYIVADVSKASGYNVLVQSFSVQNTAALGTVAVTSGSPAVVGTTTGFSNEFVGRTATFSSDTTNGLYVVTGVADSFHLTLNRPTTFNGSGGKMVLVNPVNLHWKLF